MSSAGDVNNDGLADLIVGANSADPNNISSSGASYVVFGRTPDIAVNRTGTVADQTLAGGALNDRLDGASGSDRLYGNGGDDTYITDGGDTIVEGVNVGTDMVLSSVSLALGANLDNLTLTGTAPINGTGNGGDNRIFGNSAANILSGFGGTDVFDGGLGDDTYITDGGDTII